MKSKFGAPDLHTNISRKELWKSQQQIFRTNQTMFCSEWKTSTAFGPNRNAMFGTYLYLMERNSTNCIVEASVCIQVCNVRIVTITSSGDPIVLGRKTVTNASPGIVFDLNNVNSPLHQPSIAQTYFLWKGATANAEHEPSNGREHLPYDRQVTEQPSPGLTSNTSYKTNTDGKAASRCQRHWHNHTQRCGGSSENPC